MECNPRKETPQKMFARLSQIIVVTGIIIKLINIRNIGKDLTMNLVKRITNANFKLHVLQVTSCFYLQAL